MFSLVQVTVVIRPGPSYNLNQCWLIVRCKLQQNSSSKKECTTFIQQCVNVLCEMLATLLRPKCAKHNGSCHISYIIYHITSHHITSSCYASTKRWCLDLTCVFVNLYFMLSDKLMLVLYWHTLITDKTSSSHELSVSHAHYPQSFQESDCVTRRVIVSLK